MRVLKNYNTSITNPCSNYDYGQTEDYTLNITTTPLGTETLSDAALKYYYNRASGELVVSAEEIISEISIYSATGQLLIHKNPDLKDFSIDLGRFSNGVYIINVEAGGKGKNFKLIKN
jgi:hypothetical protein